ncbi:2-amino-4-hydroxy-6-hydroxymethyldihydropteridine diphosphokinase [Halobacillus salinus]|uniref:2-amino-4-hydroxy-6-hydroxymethyldihydropteridine diphosphokinase n=1 Tax=Halobacillus salinus TaxID=192814 RepID=A0A4Z0GTE3_9BACI|nr:2-amino-4-hydroxy-6-hydroxymethyldihydropteridine diphosphokinase [Halobacillus salinus]TGB00797.1 2-amino-4-hydroxy-6-hydroxymethyldihydropteridine diphosphokinase [Halobacillus salinus]
MNHTAFIALGSNLSERERYLARALQLLDKHQAVELVEKSYVYETEPVGYTDQSDFLNMVVKVQTTLTPLELLEQCQSIEQELGRERVVKWGPRTIDLDILLYDDENIERERLIIPHPHMHERAFVMVPLRDVAPNVTIPGRDQTVSAMINQLPESDVNDMKVWGSI